MPTPHGEKELTELQTLKEEIQELKTDLASVKAQGGGELRLVLEKRLLLKEEQLAALRPAGGAGADAGMAAGTKFTVKVKVERNTYTYAKTFPPYPTWEELLDWVSDLKPLEQVEVNLMKDGETLNEELWEELIQGKTRVNLEAKSAARKFSSFQPEDVRTLLGIPSGERGMVEDDTQFQCADLRDEDELQPDVKMCLEQHSVGEFLTTTGCELARRCLTCRPSEVGKEATNTELISSILFAAAVLVGDVLVEAEHSALGRLAYGRIDYTLMYKKFAITVVEGKLHEKLSDHLGQLAAEMGASRDEFVFSVLGKRKREANDAVVKAFHKQVPSFGILTNGKVYVFHRYDASERRLVRSSCMELHLPHKVTAGAALAAAKPVIARLVHILQHHKASMDKFRNSSASDP